MPGVRRTPDVPRALVIGWRAMTKAEEAVNASLFVYSNNATTAFIAAGRLHLAFSSGQRKQLLELLTRLESAESLTGPTIERAFDLAKVRRALKAEVGALGQILA